MNRRYKLKDNETKEVLVAFGDDVEWFESLGYTEIGEVEQGYDGAWYLQGYAPKQPIEEVKAKALAQAKAERADAVSKLTVTVDGMVFDADETSQNRMSRVVAGAQALGIDQSTTQVWVLADNTVATPTIAQLAQALKLAGEAQTALWTIPYKTETTEPTAN